MRTLLVAMALALSAPAHAQAQAQDADAPTEEVIVEGRQPGPKMWVVTDADSEVWILGVTGYLPKRVTWDTTRVESVIARSDMVVTAPTARITMMRALDILLTDRDIFENPGKKKLREVLPAPLYARFSAARSGLGLSNDKYEKYSPYIAGSALLDDAVDDAGLDTGKPPADRVSDLAKRKRVRTTPVLSLRSDDLIDTLKRLSTASHHACMAANLTMIERGMPQLRDYAAAWARGDVERMRANPPPPETQACIDGDRGIQDIVGEIDVAYRRAVDQALAHPGSRLILVNMGYALQSDGLIAGLRSRGYAVEGP